MCLSMDDCTSPNAILSLLVPPALEVSGTLVFPPLLVGWRNARASKGRTNEGELLGTLLNL
jgi:hypothetical protein